MSDVSTRGGRNPGGSACLVRPRWTLAKSLWRRLSLCLCFRASRGGELDRLDDPAVSTTATHVAIHEAHDFRLGGIRTFREQRDAAHDHAGGAVGTLKRADIEQCLLQRMQFIAGS